MKEEPIVSDDMLVIELAERLYRAFWSARKLLPTELAVHMAATKNIDSERPSDLAWRSVARECLRQMRWCRFEGFDGDRDKPYDVTLAPNDWKPE